MFGDELTLLSFEEHEINMIDMIRKVLIKFMTKGGFCEFRGLAFRQPALTHENEVSVF